MSFPSEPILVSVCERFFRARADLGPAGAARAASPARAGRGACTGVSVLCVKLGGSARDATAYLSNPGPAFSLILSKKTGRKERKKRQKDRSAEAAPATSCREAPGISAAFENRDSFPQLTGGHQKIPAA